MRPRLLDLFCGAGGAGAGYVHAGFDVVGVDIKPQPHYPFEFIQADAMTFPLDGFEAIHASPPCQRYSTATPTANRMDWPDLIGPMRFRLQLSGVPWVIENVVGAPVRRDLLLCGVMFTKPIARHRIFESSVELYGPDHRPHPPGIVTITGGGPCNLPSRPGVGGPRRKPTADEARAIMEMPWATKAELNEAIPPAYSEFVGLQLLDVLERAA